VSESKAQAKQPTARKKAAAAKAEKENKPKTVEFRGLTLELLPKIPGTLLWDFQELMSGDERSLGGVVNLLESLVGFEQNRLVKDKVRRDGLDLDETFAAIEELIGNVFEASGLSLGE
jgi:hypothetical protein